jgi:hypothetical protein
MCLPSIGNGNDAPAAHKGIAESSRAGHECELIDGGGLASHRACQCSWSHQHTQKGGTTGSAPPPNGRAGSAIEDVCAKRSMLKQNMDGLY